MKKMITVILAALMLASVLASCAPERDRLDSAISIASSEAIDCAKWLDERLEDFPTEVIIGVGSSDTYGVDMSTFEKDGYILRTIGEETFIFGKTADGLDRAVRKYAKAADSRTVEDLDETYLEGERVKRLTIAGRDISEYKVYYPADANENMLFAISELVRLTELACGTVLETVQGSPSNAPAIELSFSDDASLKYDGYKYTVTENGVLFECAYKRGSMYAVWRFLENELNWHRLIYGEAYLEPADHLDVPAGTQRTETAAFDQLIMYGHFYGSYANPKATPTNEQNSYGVLGSTGHGLYRFVEDMGAYDAQVCFSDEYIYEDVEYNVREYIESELAAGKRIGVDFFGIDLGQNDSTKYCQCRDCMKTYKEEGSNSGAMVLFMNRLSEALSEDFEGLYYKFFAYAGTNVPPKKADPGKWISVTFCTDYNCSNHKLDGSECGDGYLETPVPAWPYHSNNEDYASWLSTWCEKTDSVYVWMYALNTALNQYTTLYNMYSDFRYLYSLGVEGIFYQCQFDGMGIQRVQHQMLAQLNWDISMSEEEWAAHLYRILESEYGDGWEDMLQYIDLWEKSQDYMNCWHCWGHNEERVNDRFVAANFDRYIELFNNAVYMANSKAQQNRIEWLSCSMYYIGCRSSYIIAKGINDTERLSVITERYTYMMELLHSLGFDPDGFGMYTVDGAREVYMADIEEEAEARKW